MFFRMVKASNSGQMSTVTGSLYLRSTFKSKEKYIGAGEVNLDYDSNKIINEHTSNDHPPELLSFIVNGAQRGVRNFYMIVRLIIDGPTVQFEPSPWRELDH